MNPVFILLQATVQANPHEIVIPPPTTVSHASDQLDIGTSKDIEEGDEEPADEFTSEDALRKSQKVNSVASITSLRMKPHAISHL